MSTTSIDGSATRQTTSWPELLSALIRGADLTTAESGWAMNQIMSGAASSAHAISFVTALRAKGETVDEVTGLLEAMYTHASTIEVPGRTVDLIGTGGDRSHTVNITTMAALVVAGTGAKVVKHGNRAASSTSGAADVLEALGVDLELPPQRVAEIANEAGITFCFAQAFHPAMRHVAQIRRELGIPTVFNILGPLANPARVRAQATGVYDLRMAPVVAGVLAARGSSALVFRGDDGLDELTVTGSSQVWIVRDGSVRHVTFDPREVGIPLSDLEQLRGGDPAYNAEVFRRLLEGRRGPIRDAVVLNAAAGLVALDPTDAPLAEQLAAGVARAERSIDSGLAKAVLDRWIIATRSGARALPQAV
ncbi:anthranilate phosphoribosyltransferase [Streptomyces violascens]|uniref:anthranilate phosphoribosyltransferase n=1 Tax=Streptomyces violascens TaxID=67381 RepID=UPI0036493262